MTAPRWKVDLADDPTRTERLGERIGQCMQAGHVIALTGPMGSGKTTFVRGLARGLDLDDPDGVSSPTYLLVVEHAGRLPLIHADAYLPEKLESFLADGGLEYLLDATKVTCIEWANNVDNLLPHGVLRITLGHRPDGGRWVDVQTSAPERFPWLADWRTIAEVE